MDDAGSDHQEGQITGSHTPAVKEVEMEDKQGGWEGSSDSGEVKEDGMPHERESIMPRSKDELTREEEEEKEAARLVEIGRQMDVD
jgi:hypothetical protein